MSSQNSWTNKSWRRNPIECEGGCVKREEDGIHACYMHEQIQIVKNSDRPELWYSGQECPKRPMTRHKPALPSFPTHGRSRWAKSGAQLQADMKLKKEVNLEGNLIKLERNQWIYISPGPCLPGALGCGTRDWSVVTGLWSVLVIDYRPRKVVNHHQLFRGFRFWRSLEIFNFRCCFYFIFQ